jgi:hypothetical protein
MATADASGASLARTFDGRYDDGYCERTGLGLLDEPLNAVTNLAFLVAAVLLWRVAVSAGTARSALTWLPIVLLIATGLGSLALHTFGTAPAGLADILALSLCLLATVYSGARTWLGWGRWVALAWPAGMIGLAVLCGWLLPVPGAAYLGALATGAVMAATMGAHPARPWVLAAVVLFVPSFVLRSLDQPLCNVWPVGTHFAWHLLNACVLYLAIRPLAVRS